MQRMSAARRSIPSDSNNIHNIYKKGDLIIMFRISYSREYDTNLFRVTLHVIAQTIVIDERVLIRKIGMDPRCSVGCKDLPVCEIIELGFIFPTGINRLVI